MIDMDTIFGDKVVSEQNHLYQQEQNNLNDKNEFLKLYVGRIVRVDNDKHVVDVQHGLSNDLKERNLPGNLYKNCLVMHSWGGQVERNGDQEADFYGNSGLFKMGTPVVYTFLYGMREQPVVIGSLLLETDSRESIDVCKEKNSDKNDYYKNGKLEIWKKDTGDFVINNEDIIINVINKTDNTASNIDITVGEDIEIKIDAENEIIQLKDTDDYFILMDKGNKKGSIDCHGYSATFDEQNKKSIIQAGDSVKYTLDNTEGNAHFKLEDGINTIISSPSTGVDINNGALTVGPP